MTLAEPGTDSLRANLVAGLHGTYRIEARHAEGSFGITYRARDVSTGEPVILKELRVEKLDDWKALELFEREGQVLRSLSHPNIPAFRDFFAHGAPAPLPASAMSTYAGPERLSLVLVQEFVDGTMLQQRVDQGRRLLPEEAEGVLRPLLHALRHLHERNPPLVHRDIKPGNVIVTPDGRPYLVDFGAIQDRLRSAGSVGSTIVGTLGYMPLEQIRGDARPASDLYALGVTMIVAMAGRAPSELPFDDATGKIAMGRVLPAETPAALSAVLDSMIAPLVGQRVQSAADVLARLDAAPPQQAPPRPRAAGPPVSQADPASFATAVARGRSVQAARVVEKAARRAEEEDSRSEEERRARRDRLWSSLTLAGPLRGPLGWLYVFLLVFPLWLLGGLPAMLVVAELPPGDRETAGPAVLILVGALWVSIFLWSRFAPERALARERAWLRSLPFEVDDYEACLGDDSEDNEEELRLRFEFTGEPPPAQALRDLLQGDGGDWTVPWADRAVRKPGSKTGGKHDHNRTLRSWFHRLVREQLIPLHRDYPFTSVTLANRGRRR